MEIYTKVYYFYSEPSITSNDDMPDAYDLLNISGSIKEAMDDVKNVLSVNNVDDELIKSKYKDNVWYFLYDDENLGEPIDKNIIELEELKIQDEDMLVGKITLYSDYIDVSKFSETVHDEPSNYDYHVAYGIFNEDGNIKLYPDLRTYYNALYWFIGTIDPEKTPTD
uniref:Uncharacterized protein n=1 Tax=Pithovirus LCPAC101 TaxID=2506586 RepID=A0A481Z2S8_9VIRU|nr:MAG: hypothetical protein LCPAC101_03110 [Pithovirus LCPAC101]